MGCYQRMSDRGALVGHQSGQLTATVRTPPTVVALYVCIISSICLNISYHCNTYITIMPLFDL